MGEMHGYITSPGKFEGQRYYMPEMYEKWLEGSGYEDNSGVVHVHINMADRHHYPELLEKSGRLFKRQVVKFIITDQGFVEEV